MKAIYNAESNTLRPVFDDGVKVHYSGDASILCDPSCKDHWKDGQVLEEGIDYRLQHIYDTNGFGNQKWNGDSVAYPIVKPSPTGDPFIDKHLANIKKLQERYAQLRKSSQPEEDQDRFWKSVALLFGFEDFESPIWKGKLRALKKHMIITRKP